MRKPGWWQTGARGWAGAVAGVWLGLAAGGRAEEPADARFRGAGKADLMRISNIACQPVDGGGLLSFDLAWGHSWRAAWEVPEAQHGGQGKLKLENWDAAWVFVKFRKVSGGGWRHASLAPAAGDHQVPPGVKLDPGLADDGRRALGVFLYRAAPGSGPNDWKGVKLRWRCDLDGMARIGQPAGAKTPVAPAPKAAAKAAASGDTLDAVDSGALGELMDDAETQRQAAREGQKRQTAAQAAATSGEAVEVRILAIPMVYVPQGSFRVGDGSTNEVAGQFCAGDAIEPYRIVGEQGILLGGVGPGHLGNRDRIGCADDFSTDQVRWLPPRFPKGFDSFYCMRYEITQGEMVEFLNLLDDGARAEFKELPGAANNTIAPAPKGSAVPFVTAEPYLPCRGLIWNEGAAYAAWAGLRPMTELEFEKACRGPLLPVPDEMAWGTAAVAGSNSKDPPRDGYLLRNPGQPDERTAWEGANGPDATRGNAAWVGNIVGENWNQWGVGYAVQHIARPLRSGIFATPESGRVTAGASYWGIMELSGNLCEYAVTVGNYIGRRFVGVHGDGTPALPGGWYALEKSLRIRGGGINAHGGLMKRDLRVSDRGRSGLAGIPRNPMTFAGFRAVRTAVVPAVTPIATETTLPPGVDEEDPEGLFNARLRVENLTCVPRDAQSATLRFDIAWDDSWRTTTNYDAAWVFFKSVPPFGITNATPVRLVADAVLNPAGYGQESGTKLEFVVPDGKDGFTGVFLQRAAAGAGSVTAKGVTVVAELPAGAGAAGIPDLRAFGIEMVYVPEGPFALGSGGTEENRFYQYTDGSQNTRPYRVQDAGPVPTGPQRGRLWATGLRPDAGDAGELSVAYPNGYRAFYCMKHCVRQGQFAGFLGMQSVVQSAIMAYRGGSGPVLYRHVTGGSSLTWWMGSVFGAWAGLRPMTDLEYEKACRGAREPQPDEAGPSVWGIRHLNTGEMSFFTVTAADPVGRGFQGTHGSGLPALPADWPYSNERTVGGISRRGTTLAAHSDGGPCDAVRVSSRAGATRDEGKSTGVEGCFRGWRGVRTAPALRPAAAAGGAAGGAKLELEPLPVPNDAEIFVFSLAGRFQHGGDQAIPVEVETGLPEGCFPGGAASRTFTAAAKGATPFTMQVVVTRRTLQEARRVQQLPVRIRKVGGEVLAEGAVRLPLTDPLAHVPAVIGTRENGAFVIGMTNATDQALACSLEFAPVSGLTVAEGVRKVVLPAGGGAEARFAVTRPDPVFAEGYYLLPYRLVSTGGTAQTGEVVVEVRAQSRWWVEARLADAGEESAAAVMDGELPQAGAISHPENPQKKFWNADPSVAFQAETPAKGWRAVTHGASLWVRQLNPAPKTMISAATRVFVRADQEAVLKLGFETDSWTWLDGQVLASIDFGLVPGLQPPPAKVWVNGGVVKNTRPGEKPAEGTVALKKGGNTVLLRFEALPDSKGQFPHVFLLFYDAKTGVLIRDIAYDMEKKP